MVAVELNFLCGAGYWSGNWSISQASVWLLTVRYSPSPLHNEIVGILGKTQYSLYHRQE